MLKEVVQKFFGRRLNEKGQEVPDPTPVSVPLGYKHPPTLEERIASMVKVELSRNAVRDGFESFDEANDFAVDDDNDPIFPSSVPPDEDDDIGLAAASGDKFAQAAYEREYPVIREKVSKKPKSASTSQNKADSEQFSKDSEQAKDSTPT